MRLGRRILGETRQQCTHDLGFATKGGPDKHEAMSHKGGLVELNNLQHPFLVIYEEMALHQFPCALFDVVIALLWWVDDPGKQILEQCQEQWYIVCNQL